MMKIMLLALGLLLTGTLEASCNLSSARLSEGLVKIGDSERRVIESEPDRSVRLESREGGSRGYRHDFYRRGQTVQVYVQTGKVVRVCRVRE